LHINPAPLTIVLAGFDRRKDFGRSLNKVGIKGFKNVTERKSFLDPF